MTTEKLAKTPLHALHLELGASMMPVAGYDMPEHYPLGVLKEHLHTREQVGLFDVSHMGQIILRGEQAASALESLVPVDIIDLPIGIQRYALFTDIEGGILDDLMVARPAADKLFLVVNAACKEQDLAHLQRYIGKYCEIEPLFESRALLALQGPQAVSVLARLAPDVAGMAFMQFTTLDLLGVACHISRSGYTGEDGYEISVPAAHAETLARALLAQPEVQPIGLGARESLRLEAGLCRYGRDIDQLTTPIEANLWWTISKVRRADGDRAGGFPADDLILSEQHAGVASKRVGLLPADNTLVREGADIVDGDGAVIGMVTSGGFGATLGAPLAMGYVSAPLSPLGSEVFAIVRGQKVPMIVAKTPFVPQRYHRG
ncbi:glycine cleavage system aminomethyltransferase GcvT [Pseudomonas sp. H11T01]|uniref:glycine cleavage system aminomethyltransferase GcvT n=1 Tax=Pseudomonas sp. H11T01 TaxID=3402749 RepID=UPI003AD18B6F